MNNYNDWNKDLNDSVKAIREIKDLISEKMGGDEIIRVEMVDNPYCKLLDETGGIDYLYRDENGIQSIAARVQFGGTFSTFTIRKERSSGSKTEFEKRIYAIKNGYHFPTHTLQAYFIDRKNFEILNFAIIRTVDLYKLYETNRELFNTQSSDNKFIYINWSDIKKLNIDIRIYVNEPNMKKLDEI